MLKFKNEYLKDGKWLVEFIYYSINLEIDYNDWRFCEVKGRRKQLILIK